MSHGLRNNFTKFSKPAYNLRTIEITQLFFCNVLLATWNCPKTVSHKIHRTASLETQTLATVWAKDGVSKQGSPVSVFSFESFAI